MQSLLSELVTEEQWQYYLTLLTDTVWPNGELMEFSEEQKSEEEKLKTKEDAIQSLGDFFGGRNKLSLLLVSSFIYSIIFFYRVFFCSQILLCV
jgi:hypothetical protein